MLLHDIMISTPKSQTLNPKSPTQAMLLHDIMLEKAKEWAKKSNAYVRLKDVGSLASGELNSATINGEINTFVKWVDVADVPTSAQRVKWPTLKKHKRGIEKLARGYKGDVSRLVDITRFSLFFDTFTDLTQALGVIVTDFDIKVKIPRPQNRAPQP